MRNLRSTLANLAALGVKPQTSASAGPFSVLFLEGVKVLLTEDPSIAAESKTNEWLMRVPSPGDAAAWYQKWLGASIVTQGDDVIAQIPGMNLRFVQTTAPAAGTHGRALDHIGFDVIDLPALVTKMQGAGVTVNMTAIDELPGPGVSPAARTRTPRGRTTSTRTACRPRCT